MTTLAPTIVTLAAMTAPVLRRAEPAPSIDAVALTGFLAMVALLGCRAHEGQGRRFTLGCAIAGVAAAVYGFVQGAWPLGIVEAVWAAGALRRWWRAPVDQAAERSARPDAVRPPYTRDRSAPHPHWNESAESRVTRLFGAK